MTEWIDVGRAEEIEPGRCKVVPLGDTDVAVFNVDGQFYAIEDVCSHEETPLSPGCLYGYEIECPLHGARFDIRSGEALTAPAYEPVPTYPVRVENGVVQIRDET
jgi:3-phenylpropionate/trans-cinnamate dioxygenase ferredoxin component